MRKFTAFFVALVLLLTSFAALSAISVSAEIAPSETTLSLRETFAADKKGEFSKAKDSYIGIPIVLTTFVRDSATLNKATILYVVGTNTERIGTDSDEEIINDLLDEGYIVTVADYLNNPLATGTPLSYSLMYLQSGDVNNNAYNCGYTMDTMTSYCLPAGYRIDRDVYFYSIDTMALNGTNEYILWVWNNFYAGENGVYKDANGNDLPYAETIYDCIKKDGSPMYFDLDMDIIYPANPSEDTVVPVMAHASNCETRVRHISRNDSSTVYHIQGLLEGYASIVYDHEYIPMSRNDHYGFYGNYDLPLSSFTLTHANGNAVHSAAIRRIKYLADTYGFDADYIGVTGFSKSSLGPAILADTTHEQRGEIKNYADYCKDGVDPNAYMGKQPWLTYDDGTPISSNVTVVYSGSGPGVCNNGMINVNDNCVPFASTIGTEDTTGSFKTFIDKVHGYFDSHDIESLYYTPVGLEHFVAWGYNYEFQRENVDIVWNFLDNHIRNAYCDEAPEVLYMTPKSGFVYDDPQEVLLKFSRAMDIDSVKENVKVISLSTGKEIAGEWTFLHGKTSFYFNSSQMINGDSYKVVVPVGTKAADGIATDMDFIKTFSISGDVKLQATADTYVSSFKADSNFGKEENMVVTYNNDGEEIGLISFKRDSGFADTGNASLIIDRTNDVVGPVSVYAKNGTFDENAVTYGDINKDDYTFIGIGGGNGNVISVDVSEFLKDNTSNDVTFMITAAFKQGETYSRDFEGDNADSFKQNTHYAYGAGGATMNFVDGTIYLTARNSGNRLKFIDGLGKSELVQSDLGSVYKIAARVKSDEDSTVLVGLYAQNGTVGYNPYGDSTYFLKGGEWTTIEHYVTITQQMIDLNTDCVTLVPSGTISYAIDEIEVQIAECGGTFATKESTGLTAPATLVLWTSERLYKEGELAVIGSGKDKNTVLDEAYSVNGSFDEDTSNTKMGYIKVPLSKFDTSAETVEFEFNLESAVNNKVSVYGLLDDDTRFAENFDGNISWNTAFANNGNIAEKSRVYGGKPLATVNCSGNKISIDVKSYVTYMKDKGYSAVTFLLAAQNSDYVKVVDFEGMSSYDKIVKSFELVSYGHKVIIDPTDSDNSVFAFEKSGSTSPNGYQQTLSFTGLVDEDNLFTAEDIGSVITVTFRQYNVVPEGTADCVDFGKIGKAGTSTAALANLSYVSKTTTQNGVSFAAQKTPMNEWYDVKYVINVTEEAVKNYAEHNAIVISTGWPAQKTYIDDITVTKKVGDIVITSSNDKAPVPNTDFENGSFENYSANAYMNGYEIAVKEDPTAENNKVLYIEKSGVSGSGYHQNVALTGLIKKNGVFTEDDIGNVYTVTFRQYNSVSEEHPDCYDFGNIAAVGTATSGLSTLPFVKKAMYYKGSEFATQKTPMNEWYDVKYTITVTEETVASYSNATAIVLATGWTGNGIYIDDVEIDVVYGENENTLDFVPITDFINAVSFENAVANDWLSRNNYDSGIIEDPVNITNMVYYFDKSGNGKSGANSYLENMALTGLIKTDNVFTENDIGRVYTVRYKQYNVVPEGAADCKDFSVLGVAGTTGTITSGHYQQPSFVKKDCYYNGAIVSGANIPMNAWYEVVFKFTVTEEAVASYSNYTSILVACGMPATRCYLDDIKVSVEGVTFETSSVPGIVYNGLYKDDMAAAGVIDSANPELNGKSEDIVTLRRSPQSSADGIRKVYATFDKSEIKHIQSALLHLTVSNPTAGNTLYIYGLNSSVDVDGLTWNNAYGNDIDSNGAIASVVYGGAPIAEITLTDDTVYETDITEYLMSVESDDFFTVIITGKEEEGATEISAVNTEFSGTDYSDTPSQAAILSPAEGQTVSGTVRISAHTQHSVDRVIEKTEFYIDGELFGGYVQETGDIRFIDLKLSDGEHSVYAVFTYNDATSCRTEAVTFTVGATQTAILGDVDGDGYVNTTDLAALKLYLAGIKTPVTAGADLDLNGEINTTDLASLKLKLAGN